MHENIVVCVAIAAGLPPYGPGIAGGKRDAQISGCLIAGIRSGKEVLPPVQGQCSVRNGLADNFRNGVMLLIIFPV